MEELALCLNNIYFKYKDNTYKQTFGCAMGSPVSSVVANIFMETLETSALQKLRHVPKFYYRYVDDVITYEEDSTDERFAVFTAYNSNIQFTVEWEENSEIAFLDGKLVRVSGANNIRAFLLPFVGLSW